MLIATAVLGGVTPAAVADRTAAFEAAMAAALGATASRVTVMSVTGAAGGARRLMSASDASTDVTFAVLMAPSSSLKDLTHKLAISTFPVAMALTRAGLPVSSIIVLPPAVQGAAAMPPAQQAAPAPAFDQTWCVLAFVAATGAMLMSAKGVVALRAANTFKPHAAKGVADHEAPLIEA